jgi:hypothetical protein
MTAPPPSETTLNQALRGVHRSVLALLLVCAGVIVFTAPAGDDSPAEGSPRSLAYLAAGLGGVAILTRRRQVGAIRNLRAHLVLCVTSGLCAGGVGLVGVAVAAAGGTRTTALVYVLAGAIFALRPPPPVTAAPSGSSGPTP